MRIEYDEAKRRETLERRGLDMAHAEEVFDDAHQTVEDTRRDYGERRFQTAGYLRNRLIFVVWTRRGNVRRIISMRKANEREQRYFGPVLGR